MKLSAWKKRTHNRIEELEAVLAFTTAVNEDHKSEIWHGSFEPDEIDVSGTSCTINVTLSQDARYRSPELMAGGSADQKADVYSAGTILYEMLAGKHPYEGGIDRPAPLREVRPDISEDLADAITACVELDPEWRPGDLTYVQQVAERLFAAAGGASEAARPSRPAAPPAPVREPAPASRPAPTRAAAPLSEPRATTPSGSKLPLIIGIAAVVAAAAGGAWYFLGRTPPKRTAETRPQTTAAPAPVAPAETGEEPAAEDPLAPRPGQEAAAAPAAPATDQTAPPATAAPPVTTAPPATAAPTTAPALAPAPTPPPRATPPPTTRPPGPAPTTEPAQPVESAAPEPPPTAPPVTQPPLPRPAVKTVSPATLRRGANGVIDVHGAALRNAQRPVFTAVKTGQEVPGIHVLGRRVVRDTLMQVSLRVEADVKAGPYNFGLVDENGQFSNVVVIQVN